MDKLYIIVAVNGYTASGVLDEVVVDDNTISLEEKVMTAVELIAKAVVTKIKEDTHITE